MRTFTIPCWDNLKKKCNIIAFKPTAILTLLCIFSWASYAQAPLKSHYEAYSWNSGDQAQVGLQSNQEDHTVNIPDATWLRLYFNNVNLSEGSHITITSLKDGGTQTLTSKTIAEWGNSSAYFNGNEVKVTLVKAGKEASIAINELEVGEPQNVSTFSQCGPQDNRVSSNDAAVGRLVPIGCTGWIIRNGKLVTAGHCTGSRMQVLEFNVPLSNPDRSIVHPGPEDQYAVGNVTVGSRDWAVFNVSVNSQTGLSPIQAQGKSYNVVRVNSASTIRITGYGVDTGRSNQTLQTHAGPYVSSSSTRINYTADTEGGNSGSPVIDDATGNAIGVHTNGGCRTNGSGSNFGTNARLQAFWDAMGLDGGGGPDPVNYCASQGGNNYEYIARVAVGNLNSSSNGLSPYTNFTSRTANLSPGSSYTMSLTPGFTGSAYTEHWRVWIDFNKDGDFTDSGESVFTGSGRAAVSGTVNIPGNASGTTRMRVSMKYNSAVGSSCGDIGDGEVEDYTVSFGGSAAIASRTATPNTEAVMDNINYNPLQLFPNPASDMVKVLVGDHEKGFSVKVYNMQGAVQTVPATWNNNKELIMNISLLPQGMYLVTLKTEREVINQKLMVE